MLQVRITCKKDTAGLDEHRQSRIFLRPNLDKDMQKVSLENLQPKAVGKCYG
jgi:hypothetical protein